MTTNSERQSAAPVSVSQPMFHGSSLLGVGASSPSTPMPDPIESVSVSSDPTCKICGYTMARGKHLTLDEPPTGNEIASDGWHLFLTSESVQPLSPDMKGTAMNFRRTSAADIEAITFDELVEHGKAQGAPLHDGMPWSFTYKGLAITHENNDCYLILEPGHGSRRFNRGDRIVTIDGRTYPLDGPYFDATYEPEGAET